VTSRFRVAGLTAAALGAAAFLFAGFGLPASHLQLAEVDRRDTVSGAFHVHTSRSDGSGSVEEVAEAAARAGLQFVIFTDHGDASRPPEPPRYRGGVLCLDAVEISTTSGHYVAVGLPEAPYPLGGEARDVVEDVARLGGFGIAAHPESPKPALRWAEWTAPFDALEWLNADSEWRDERAVRLAGAFLGYPVRPVGTIASLLDRPESALRRWDTLTLERRITTIAGVDAHGRLGLHAEDEDAFANRWFLRVPAYETSFRTFVTRVQATLSGDAAKDATLLLDALRAGRSFTAIHALASPAHLHFSAKNASATAEQGAVLGNDGPLELTVRSNAPEGSTVTLFKDGSVLASSNSPELTFAAGAEPGVFRLEVTLPDAPGHPPIPWLLSNPIWVEPAGWPTTPPPRPAATETMQIGAGGWHVERDPGSTAEILSMDDGEWLVRFRYELGKDRSVAPYSALVLSTGSALRSHDRVTFRASADRPMRMSVQARRMVIGERWQRSIYLDSQPRDLEVHFDDMRPVSGGSAPRFNPAEIDSLLFVVDATHTRPGTAGSFSLANVKLAR
jgi:hypothetical protein